ncbi:SusC/RagA family TonB-linked outer membrane protein [Saccharicrinis fermentans]|uniref:Outer membrane cobalamin receptor protein n=1 Tax=Saccharicrinis fermentans DSM 9555 = JCM 21142 TaxID=869213 RepID=W7Y5D7_9BACT|nr:TonB-dependent receptor [Saccharicrinis fermentans]GAF02783.1 outer membrane cobalamin receptor protein [Saccharicrinis fermentans DSM 9555 = JCM 21142]
MKKIKTKFLLLAIACLMTSFSWAQQRTISGTVIDESGETLPGVNVFVKGTTSGTISDIEGKYSIMIPDGASATLVYSFVGFATQEIAVGNQSSINVQLVSDAIGLDEVVAIGYGSVKKSDLTGSVESINAEKLTEMSKTDVGQAIQGQVAGVDVRRLSSKPGAQLSIKIRGNTVLKNTNVTKDGISDDLDEDLSKPLYVVDGVFMDDLSILNPSDIEKMDVLKDASATAIYGSRGANGVVIITTKTGVSGKMQVTYDGTFGVNTATNVPDFYNGDEYVSYVSDALRGEKWEKQWEDGVASVEDWNNTVIDTDPEFFDEDERNNVANRNYTNWIDLIKETGIQTSHTLGFSGGESGLLYNASVGYTKDEGLMGIENYERYNISSSLSKKVSETITVGVRSYFAYSDREEGSKELFRSSLRLAPTLSAYEEDGSIKTVPDAQDVRFINPLYEANGSWEGNTRKYNMIANAFIEIRPTDWFNFKTNFAPELITQRYGEYRGLLTKTARNDQSRTRAYYETDFSNSYTWDNIANFDFNIKDGHNLKATFISSIYLQQEDGSDFEIRNIDSDSYSYYNIEGGDDIKVYDSYYSKETLTSFASRINYNIQEKYLFTFTGRYDGSSKLAKGNKWAFFPSAAFAWRVSQEPFLVDKDWLSNLKLRLSYGESGNDGVVSRYASQAYLSDDSYLFGNQSASGKVIDDLSNDDLRWERSKEYNIGVDLGLFDGRIRLGAEYYNKKTVDAILGKTLMALTGFSESEGNYGSVRNSGVELVLNTVNVKKGDFRWTSSFNFAKNKNEVVELTDDIQKQVYGTHGVLMVGQPIDAVYSYEKIGIWQMDEAAEAAKYGFVPGQYKFKDQNNDGILSAEDDKVVIGSNSPDWTGGMTNNFNYKNLDLSVMVYTRQGVFGHSEFYSHFAPHNGDGATFNHLDMDYWTPNNQDAENPMPGVGSDDEWYFADMSFVKVGNIGLGYNMPKQIINKLNISSLRFSLDVQNPFTFSDYKGPDPETGLQNSYNMAYSVRTVLFGLKLKL